MDKIKYNYSLKNIPTPHNNSYKTKLIEKIESVIKRMRWRAHFYLNKEQTDNNIKETFGFNSRKCPPSCTELTPFEKDMLDIITSLKYRDVKDAFQKKLKKDIREIKNSKNVFVFADKTSNIYEISKEDHKKLLHDNVTKTYRKAPPKLETSINMEAKHNATNLELSDKIECIAKSPSFVTLKDHKDNFRSNPTYRLINPSKNALGKVSKKLVENINCSNIEKLKLRKKY